VRICVALLALVACKGASPEAKRSPAASAEGGPAVEGGPAADAFVDGSQCPQQPFAESTPLAEASGAAWLTIDGKLSLVVVADSGHTGDYAVIDPDTGVTREQGKLPLGTGGDDLEGLAAREDTLFGLTSDGTLRVWRRAGTAFELVDGPYLIGSKADKRINYEGLALAPAPQGGLAGFACSKGDGGIYALVERDGRFAVDPAQRIAVTRAGVLGDCAFSDRGVLWVGNNVFGLNQVFRVDGWAAPATANVVATNAFGVGFPEVIAARGDDLYRMSDTGGSPSLMAKFRCSAIPR
jgi:hypothetical protein